MEEGYKCIMKVERIRNEKDFIEYIHSQQFYYYFFFAMAIIFAICWRILIWNENRITLLDANIITEVDTLNYKFNLDNVEWKKDAISITDDFVKISGWIIKPGQQVDKAAIKIVLKNTTLGDYYVLPTDVAERPDVTAYFNDGNNYDYCSFSVRVPYWKELDGTDYEILVQYDLNNDSRVYVPFNTTIKKKAEEQKNAQ